MHVLATIILAAALSQIPPMPTIPGKAPKRPKVLVMSPKLAEQVVSAGAPMVKAAVAAPKPRVFKLEFTWSYTGPKTTFWLFYGQVQGKWTSSLPTGTTNFYSFSKTNWNEAGTRHFYVVKSETNGLPSNEVHYPPYPDDHVRVSWKTVSPTRVLTSNSLSVPRSLWAVLATVTATNFWEGVILDGPHFFAIDRNERVSISTFNPLN